MYLGQVVEGKHALAASPQLAGSLRAAQQQNAQDGGFAAGEIVGLLQPVLILRHPAVGAADGARQPFSLRLYKASRTAFSSRLITGSRLDFWLHALTSAFSDSG